MVSERQAGAIRAARLVADQLDLGSIEPLLLRDSTHVSLKLSPLPIVARILTSIEPWEVARAQRELAVSRFLADQGAPVVAPLKDRSGPHFIGDHLVTLWGFVESAGTPNERDAGHALARAHDVLLSYGAELPSFLEALEDARRLLDKGDLGPLTVVDRAFLREEFERLRGVAEGRRQDWRTIHGDAHLGNVLSTSAGPLWTDWESVCIGPLEWELSSLRRNAWPAWPAFDERFLTAMQDLRSVCVSVWCWALHDRGEVKLDAARYHLDLLKAKAHRS